MEGSVLSDKQIREEIKKGNIIYIPGEEGKQSKIGNCSVDLTLGKYCYRSRNPELKMFNPWNNDHVNQYWNSLEEAIWVENMGQAAIVLSPQESILCHTNEFIGGKNYITTMVKARSTMGRANITVCRDAGWGDIGYVNRWTLEVTNYCNIPVILPVGYRIAQLVFFYTGKTENPYLGKYQSDDNMEQLIKNWKPESMLPKASLDFQEKL